MRIVKKKTLALITAFCLLVSTVTLIAANVESTLAASVYTVAQLKSKLVELEGKYPTGTYALGHTYDSTDWGGDNHQCWGFARQVFFELWGIYLGEVNTSTSVHADVHNLKVGDHIRYNGGGTVHSIIITDIQGEDVYYADNNGAPVNGASYKNRTNWDRPPIKKSTISSWLKLSINITWYDEKAGTHKPFARNDPERNKGYGYIETYNNNDITSLSVPPAPSGFTNFSHEFFPDPDPINIRFKLSATGKYVVAHEIPILSQIFKWTKLPAPLFVDYNSNANGTNQNFEVGKTADGWLAFKAQVNGRYVTVDKSNSNAQLAAFAASVGANECFAICRKNKAGGGYEDGYYIASRGAGKFVSSMICTEAGHPLYACSNGQSFYSDNFDIVTPSGGKIGMVDGTDPGVYSAVKPMIAGGESHSLALKSDGTVWVWGETYYGQLADSFFTTTVQVSSLSGVTAIAAGAYHSLALKSDGTVWAWGWNGNGQLGDGTATDRYSPVKVSSLSGVTAIAAGWDYSLALKSDGTVWAWGWNGDGQLGDGTTTVRHTPVKVSSLSGVTAIAAGAYHSLALKSDGTVWAWGWNG
ncbi:MAG: hypothetical protein FWH42_06320, partial [Dehalococcoidia bacterium]|nr:hypothetical protein [Dehalococcoidia bacterium]